jgi:hypothetical protein
MRVNAKAWEERLPHHQTLSSQAVYHITQYPIIRTRPCDLKDAG